MMGLSCMAQRKDGYGICEWILLAFHFAKVCLEARALKTVQLHQGRGYFCDLSSGWDEKAEQTRTYWLYLSMAGQDTSSLSSEPSLLPAYRQKIITKAIINALQVVKNMNLHIHIHSGGSTFWRFLNYWGPWSIYWTELSLIPRTNMVLRKCIAFTDNKKNSL